jgi:uncharacterized protein YbjT (DUF2867 family)
VQVVIAGGHGQIALHLERLLADSGHRVIALIRSRDQDSDVREAGGEPVICDLEREDDLSHYLQGSDAVVFAAGAGPGSGAARKDTVDRAAAALLADAAERAGVRRYLLVSAIGAADPPSSPGDVFGAYLRAKAAADDDLARRDLAWTILRPGGLLDDPGDGLVRLQPSVGGGAIPRDDVAAVLLALLDTPASAGRIWEVVSGETPIPDAIAALLG